MDSLIDAVSSIPAAFGVFSALLGRLNRALYPEHLLSSHR